MDDWTIEGNELKIERRGGPGCLLAGVGIIGIFLFCGGCIGLYSTLYPEPGEPFFIVISFVITMLGYVFIMAGFRSPVRNFTETVIIDRGAQKVRFVSNRNRDYPFDVPFHDVSHIHTVSESRMDSGSGSSTSRSYRIYQIFLIKKDGAQLWITQFRNDPESFTKLTGAIADLTGFAVMGEIEFPARETYESGGFGASAPSPGRFIKMTAGTDGYEYVLKKPAMKLPDLLTAVAAFSIFLLIPGYLAFSFWSSGILPLKILITAFVSIFYAIFFLVVLAMLKECRVSACGKGIEIFLRFSVFRFLDTRTFIPREEIRYVRVNRLEEGHFSLSLGISREVRFRNPAFPFLANLSGFRRGYAAAKIIKNEKSISLWEIPCWTKSGEGPTVSDLLYLEKTFQDTLRLREEPV